MQLDYLFGRRIESVEEGGADDAAWSLVLEGGARIVVFDHGYGIPDAPAVEGLALTAFDRYQGQIRLFFGTDENPQGTVVNLPPGRYGVSDDVFTQGEVVDPDAPPVVHPLPSDPEAEREAQAIDDEETRQHFPEAAQDG